MVVVGGAEVVVVAVGRRLSQLGQVHPMLGSMLLGTVMAGAVMVGSVVVCIVMTGGAVTAVVAVFDMPTVLRGQVQADPERRSTRCHPSDQEGGGDQAMERPRHATNLHATSLPQSRRRVMRSDSPASTHSSVRRSRSALPITDTELKLIAALAIIGLSSRPKAG